MSQSVCIFRVYLLIVSIATVINFAITNNPDFWVVLNICFIITPIWYYLVMKNDMNKTVFVLLLILGLITIYQYFVGEWSATEPGWLWNLVDTVVVVLYAYLAGSKLRLS